MEMRRTQKTSTRALFSGYTENMAPRNDVINGGGGLLFFPPPSFSNSYPPMASQFKNPSFHNYQKLMNQQQPPLLPLPISSRPNNNFVSSRSRGLSSPPNTRKANGATRDQSLTPKKVKKPKQKQQPPNKREEEPKQESKSTESSIMVSVSPLGPDPNDLPKLGKFSDSVFTFSPPPSSLPLPKFSLRRKLSCNAEAAAFVLAFTLDLPQPSNYFSRDLEETMKAFMVPIITAKPGSLYKNFVSLQHKQESWIHRLGVIGTLSQAIFHR
ncbi:hypothetical protein HS088_TW06G01368 [Tripterygium wilfordii]|uniref:Uncharacterized protein n=1 Tax=Tripterygium wilfordii TaxID=458696 RepID=A0A7J7DLH7_TRIWF|nr:hypothetical protein HS088_TW06G01368 [Tripterygium wilfordii]